MPDLPQFIRIRQSFEAPQLTDPAQTTQEQLERLCLAERVQPGQRVAITAGSRGIAHIAEIVRAIVQHLVSLRVQPFIVPAMGSHGGGTAEGQRAVIEGYGITEAYCGCPILSSMETVEVCQADEGFPVHFDRHAWEADHVIVCGRIKPHTGFVGPIESGLMKMMLIGLGKHAGAKVYHRAIQNFSFDQIVRSVGRAVIARCGILAGVAIVENQHDETALIEAVLPEQFESREPELLKIAKQLLPRIPFDEIDLLVVDRIGKNVSGTGMDTNVVGRKYNDHAATGEETPRVKRIAVRDLTSETHGNATGIGIAEFCHARVLEKMDVQATRVNCLTGGHPTAAMRPLDYPCDQPMCQAALETIGLTPPSDARIVWIPNTLDLVEIECSQAYLPVVEARPDLEIIAGPREIPFDPEGNLPWFADTPRST